MISTSLYLVSCLVLGLGLLVWRARPASRTNQSFGAFTLLSALWILGVAFFHSGTNLSFWAPVGFAASSLLPAALLMFARYYPTPTQWPSRWILYLALIIGLLFAVISITTGLIVDITLTPSGAARERGPLYPLFAANFLVIWTTALVVVISKWTRARGLARVQLQYLALGFAMSGGGGIISNLIIPFLTGSAAYTWIGPHFALACVAMVAHAIVRHRLMDVRLVIHRSLTFTLAVVVSLLPVAGLLALAWPRLSDHLAPEELAALILAVVALSLLIPLMRDAAERLLDRYVYRTHVNYQRTLREASKGLTGVLDLKVLLPFLNHTVAISTNSEGSAVYLSEPARGSDGRFARAIAETTHADGGFHTPEETPTEVIAALRGTRDLLLTDEIGRESPSGDRAHLLAELARLGWALVLPLVSEDKVIGAIVVGSKRSGDPFYPQDLDLLMTLANQAGIAVKNAQLYAQVVLANEHLNNIVSTIESGVVAVDPTGQITLFNRAAEQLTGLPVERVRFQSASVLPACVGTMLIETVVDGSARTEPEVELSDGTTTRPIICTTSPLHDQTGAVLGAVAVFSDLTPHKNLELERQRTERLAYFEMLAAGIAHEIKNPLVSIKTFAQLLPRRRSDDRFIETFGNTVTHQIARIERLLDRLRALSRPGERPRHRIDLRGPIGDAIEAMRPAFLEKSVVLSAATGQSPCVIVGDRSELEQLFLNLLMNAHEATPAGGMARIELAVTSGRVIVAVVDTGPGVPAELLERVFDPFFSTKEQGSGLGLAICASIARAHAGRIQAENRPVGGAVFTVDLPLSVTADRPVPA
jgi:two-component system nitrogen regulation sensor histidine kinase GlnL